MFSATVFGVFLFLSLCCPINSLLVEEHGGLSSTEGWEFVTRFCFLSKAGKMEFTIEYLQEYATPSLAFYYDHPKDWEAVYGSSKNCSQKMAVLYHRGRNREKLLSLGNGYCKLANSTNIPGKKVVRCTGEINFTSYRERWWYVAVSRCKATSGKPGVYLSYYKIHMTNAEPGDFLHHEFSADEFYIFPINMAYLIAYIVVMFFSIICAAFLRERQLFHTTYKLYLLSVSIWMFGLFLLSIAYGVYGGNGLVQRGTKTAGRFCCAVGVLIFLIMIILLGKGFTVTRGRLSTAGTIKLSIFTTIYVITYCCLFVWEAYFFDPGLVLYLYESAPGYAIIVLRLIGLVWFWYGVFFTLKHYREKKSFYIPFTIVYSLWFVIGPIMILVANLGMKQWFREKAVVGAENTVMLVGHVFFLILTRPHAANKNFPYHVRTTQIGLMEDAPHMTEQGGAPGGASATTMSFSSHPYSVSTTIETNGNAPDLSVFITTRSRNERRPSGTLTKEVQKTASNHTFEDDRRRSVSEEKSSIPPIGGRLPPIDGKLPPISDNETSEPVENSGAPPSYEHLFRASSVNEAPS